MVIANRDAEHITHLLCLLVNSLRDNRQFMCVNVDRRPGGKDILSVGEPSHCWSCQTQFVLIKTRSSSCHLVDCFTLFPELMPEGWILPEEAFLVLCAIVVSKVVTFTRDLSVFVPSWFWHLIIWVRGIRDDMLMAIEIEIKLEIL